MDESRRIIKDYYFVVRGLSFNDLTQMKVNDESPEETHIDLLRASSIENY